MGDVIIDQVTSYASLLLIFDALRIDQLAVRKIINECLGVSGEEDPDDNQQSESKIVELPVYYSEESGPELSLISQNNLKPGIFCIN